MRIFLHKLFNHNAFKLVIKNLKKSDEDDKDYIIKHKVKDFYPRFLFFITGKIFIRINKENVCHHIQDNN